MEAICYYAYWASTDLAAERGRYSSYTGSLWDRASCRWTPGPWRRRGGFVEVDRSSTLDWDALRARSRPTACAIPTASPSRRRPPSPTSSAWMPRSSPASATCRSSPTCPGEFTVINSYLVRDLKRLGLWDDVMVMDLKHFDGSLRPIDRVPQDIKALYATAFEVETQWLVEAAARRQKWIDQAQSLNIYMAGASGKKLDDTYKMAWVRGLKTTYYLRTMSPRTSRNPPVSAGRLNAVSSAAPTTGPAMACRCSLKRTLPRPSQRPCESATPT